MTSVEVAIPWHDSGCEHRRASWDWIRAGWAIRHAEWPLVVRANEGPFSIPASLNAAIRASTADVLILTGTDAQVSADALRKCVEAVASGQAAWAMASDQMVRLGAVATEKALKTPVGSTLPQEPGGRRICQLGWGPLVISRAVADAVTYDERLHVAWEDSAWAFAAATLFGEPFRMKRTSVRMLWHPRERRFRKPGYAEAEHLMELYKAAYRVGDRERVEKLMAEGRS